MKNKLYLLVGAIFGVLLASLVFLLSGNRWGTQDNKQSSTAAQPVQATSTTNAKATAAAQPATQQPTSEASSSSEPATEPSIANSGQHSSDGSDFLRAAYSYHITIAPPIKSFYSKYKGKHSDVKYELSDLNFSYCLEPEELRNARDYWIDYLSKDFTCVNHKHYYHLDGGTYTAGDVNENISGDIIWWFTDINLLDKKKYARTPEDAAKAYSQVRELFSKYLKNPKQNNQDGKLLNGLAERTIVYTETTDKVLDSQVLVGEEKRVFPGGDVMYFSSLAGYNFKNVVVEKYQSLFIGRINKLATARLQREVYFEPEYSFFGRRLNGLVVSVYDKGADKRSTAYEYLYLPLESFDLAWFTDYFRAGIFANYNDGQSYLPHYSIIKGKEVKTYPVFDNKHYLLETDAEGNEVYKWFDVEEPQEKKK